MGKSAKKRKAKTADFQKTRIKVGKGKAPPSNATDTSFTSKGLTVLGQFHHINETDDGSEKPIKLLFANLRNSSKTVRQSAINSLKEAALSSATQAARYLDGAVKFLPQILSDDDAEVRKSALELSSILLSGCSRTQLAPFLSSFGACCSLVLSHINWLVKLDGLKMDEEKDKKDKISFHKAHVHAYQLKAKFIQTVLKHAEDPMSYVGFYERITLDVLRLLKGNTRAQIRNTVFEIIVKMLRDQIDRNGLPGNPHVVTQKIKMRMPGFDQPLEASLECQHLEVHLNTLILPAADSIIQETFATNPSANQLPRKAFENTMKILSMMVRAEHLLHKWITSRMLNHFPMEHGNVNIELDVVIINLRFAKLYAKSYRSTYNHPNAVEPVLRQRIEDYVIKVFTEQGHPRGIEGMELAVKTVVAVKSMGLDLFKYVVNYLERTRFTDRKKLGVLATVFKYLERDFDESSKVIINFAMDNMTNILDQLLKQVPEASSCDLTLAVLRSALRCCNSITRTHIFRSPNKQWDFYQQLSLVLTESIAIISLLPVSFQQEVFSVIFVLPPQWLQPLLNRMQPDILEIWEAGSFDPGFMQKFITAIPGQMNTLEFAMKVLFRPSDHFRGDDEEDYYKNIEGTHDAIYYCLIAAEKNAMIKQFVEYEIEEYRMFEYSPEHISIWLTLARARIYGCECHESLISLPSIHILRVAANFMIEFEKKSVVKNLVEKHFRYERILPFLKAYTTETEDRMNKWCDYVSRLARNREVCNRNCLKSMLKLHAMKKDFADKPFYMVCQRELEVIINQTNDDEIEW